MKQFQILTILSLINLNSYAMLRRPAALIKQAATIRLSSCTNYHPELKIRVIDGQATISQQHPTTQATRPVHHKHLYHRLEHAIATGNTQQVKQLIATKWVNLSRKEYHNHRLTIAEFAQLHGNPEIIALFTPVNNK